MHLIGIHGKARSGKDTCAAYLVKHHGFVRQAFADPLKKAAQHIFGLTHDETWSDSLKETVIPYWGMSPRIMFQKLGTEAGRNVFGTDLWLKRWCKFYDDFGANAHIVVPDVRFDNEAELVRNLGGKMIIITSDRGLAEANSKAHASEAGVEMAEDDILLSNNGSYQALYARLDHIMQDLRHREDLRERLKHAKGEAE